ncbi:DUF72 domain-containing protein [Comamonas piscis]|uniref:DUF72 domain-containing protein n=1 Tax=Comamonas piscis TaxID=1562974 RepID=A0A7G5EIH8_9BURK|nr:DUF72 domain-containing protein [Comamonas piscis]QMV73803.1 DUF72 domain-containing protein [Comamonas piscis]WSO32227.1 DUF72 domain-containing protein [Comamonas piscis]
MPPAPDLNLDLFGAEPAPPALAPTPAAPAGGSQDLAAPSPTPPTPAAAKGRSRAQAVGAAYPLLGEDLAPAMPALLRMGGSSWSYPGWQGMVWDKAYSERILAQRGLSAYAEHPLLRTVSIDRSFYRPLAPSEYALYAAQVPADFRFVVKAPALVCDAQVRSEEGRGREPNPAFLNVELALSSYVRPACEGLLDKLGVLLFQLSPLPLSRVLNLQQTLAELEQLALAVQTELAHLPAERRPIVAFEVRDPDWLRPDVAPQLAQILRQAGATYCLGLHAKMPRMPEQLPLLRALWPGPLVCRWNVNPIFGPYGYADAEKQLAPFDRIQQPDPPTLALLASTLAAVCGKGQPAYVTVSNEAEGCGPLSIVRLAQAIADLKKPDHAGPA